MKSAIIAGVVAMLVSSASATAAFVVTSKSIKNGTIQTVDLSAKAKKALKGRAGPAGARGLAGPQGKPGFVSATRLVSATFPVAVNDTGTVHTVSCPAGTGVISGGVVSEAQGDTWVDAPSGNGWRGAANNYGGTDPGQVTVYALCARRGTGTRSVASSGPPGSVGAHPQGWAPTPPRTPRTAATAAGCPGRRRTNPAGRPSARRRSAAG